MKLIDAFWKRDSIKPVNLALLAAVGTLMGILIMVIFRVS
jgi:hypothetical protein